MAERERQAGEVEQRRRASSMCDAGRVAEGLRARLDDPRHLAEELIRERLGVTRVFLGEGTADCPWIVFDREEHFYALYLRGRELVQKVVYQPDRVACVL